MGCKRVLFNNFGYLESLHKPNVQLIYDGLTEITEDGVLMKGGKHSVILIALIMRLIRVLVEGDKIPLDVIILATGFVAVRPSFHIYSRSLDVDGLLPSTGSVCD